MITQNTIGVIIGCAT